MDTVMRAIVEQEAGTILSFIVEVEKCRCPGA
jgi:hypothetical protein